MKEQIKKFVPLSQGTKQNHDYNLKQKQNKHKHTQSRRAIGAWLR